MDTGWERRARMEKKANTGRFIVSGVYVERHISMLGKAVDEDAADKREPFKNGN